MEHLNEEQPPNRHIDDISRLEVGEVKTLLTDLHRAESMPGPTDDIRELILQSRLRWYDQQARAEAYAQRAHTPYLG